MLLTKYAQFDQFIHDWPGLSGVLYFQRPGI